MNLGNGIKMKNHKTLVYLQECSHMNKMMGDVGIRVVLHMLDYRLQAYRLLAHSIHNKYGV